MDHESTWPRTNQTNRIGDTLPSKVLTVIESSPISADGVPMRRLRSGSSEIRGPSGKAGAVAKPIDSAALELAWQERDAEAVDIRLHRFLKPHETLLKPTVNEDFEVTAYTGTLPATLRPMVQRLTAPAGAEAVMRAAARCLAATVSRPTDQTDLKMKLAVFAEELAEFPEDVVATAFRKWAQREKWWPSLSEIRDQCQRLNRVRQSLKRLAA